MSSFGGALRAAFRSPAPWLSWVALTLALGLSGPFGTYTQCTLLHRTFCFATLVGISLVWGVFLRVFVQYYIPALGYWGAALVVIGVSAVVLPEPLLWLAPRLTGLPAENLPRVVEVAALIVAFGCGAAAVRWAISLRERVTAEPPEAGSGRRLLTRLAPEVRGEVVRLIGSNHYVSVITDKGEAKVLMRLSDAIAELDGAQGLQVHRSHWVSTDAIAGTEKKGAKRELVLKDGSRVPVSRNYLDALAERQLI